MGVCPEPESEEKQCRHDRHGHAPRVLDQERGELPIARAELPKRQGDRDRNDQREGFVKKADADHAAPDPRPDQSFRETRLLVQEQECEGSKKPEGLGRTRQKDPAIAVGAEEAEKKERRGDAERWASRALPPDEHEQSCGEECVEDIGGAQQGERPVIPPIGREDPLPEEKRRFGVTGLFIHRLERKQVAALRGELRDLGVEEFVPVGRKVIASQSRAVDEECEDDGTPSDPDGALVDDVMRRWGISHRVWFYTY